MSNRHPLHDEYPEYSKDQEIHDLQDIISGLETKIESLEKKLLLHDVIVSDFCECTYIRHNDTWTTEDGKAVCCHCRLPKQK